MAEPDVAVVPPAHDVVLVGGSIFVHAHVPIDVHTTINMDMGASVYVRGAMMAAPTVMAPTPFRVRCRHDSKPERRRNRKNETNLLQHFVFRPKTAVSAWNERQAKRMSMLFSPTIGAAITAGYWFLWARCSACRTTNAIDLRTLDRHHYAVATSLIPALSCRSCRPNAPFAELVRLSRTTIADEMRDEHRRRVQRRYGPW
jgi:hypothetical protein